MGNQTYLTWLTNWFAKQGSLPEDALHRDFFKEGWLDSFKTIELITQIENEFDLSFSDADFIDPRFCSIAGLSAILTEIGMRGQHD